MLSEPSVRFVLQQLTDVLRQNIEGDIVELGCNKGTSALFIQKMLTVYDSSKLFHVYDSFEGLPEKSVHDQALTEKAPRLIQGKFKVDKEVFIQNFIEAKLELPHIHKGWFAEIPDEEYPDRIAFAFFDGDFYSSIYDSFVRIYPRLTPGALVLIHDCENENLPGAKKACHDFLADKPERETFTTHMNFGWMKKL